MKSVIDSECPTCNGSLQMDSVAVKVDVKELKRLKKEKKKMKQAKLLERLEKSKALQSSLADSAKPVPKVFML